MNGLRFARPKRLLKVAVSLELLWDLSGSAWARGAMAEPDLAWGIQKGCIGLVQAQRAASVLAVPAAVPLFIPGSPPSAGFTCAGVETLYVSVLPLRGPSVGTSFDL